MVLRFLLSQDLTRQEKIALAARYPTIWSSEAILYESKSLRPSVEGPGVNAWMRGLGLQEACEGVTASPPDQVAVPWRERPIDLLTEDKADWQEINVFIEAAGLSD